MGGFKDESLEEDKSFDSMDNYINRVQLHKRTIASEIIA
jgi:hypothetical protein